MDSLLSSGVRRDRSLPDPQALPDPTALADTVALADADHADTKLQPDTQARPDATVLPDAGVRPDAEVLPATGALPAMELLPAEPAPAGLLRADAGGADLIGPGPADARPADAGAAYRGPAYAGPAYPGSAYPGPAYAGPAYPGPAYPEPAYPEPADPEPAYPEPVSAEPASAEPGDGPGDEPGAGGRDQGARGPDASALVELELDEIRPGLAKAAAGAPGQPGSDQSEPDDLDADPTVSGRLIAIGLLSGSGRLALAGAAPELPTVGGTAAASASAWLAQAREAAQDWASRRSFGLNSACGVSIALAVCAAGWFSAGTRSDILRGVGALWAGYLALKAGQFIAAPPQPHRSSQPAGSRQRRRGEGSGPLAAPVALDIAAPVILEPGPEAGQPLPPPSRDEHQAPGVMPPLGAGQPSGRTEPSGAELSSSAGLGHVRALRRPGTAAGWVAAVGISLAESVVYLGLAVGAAAEHWGRAWSCALAVLGLVAVRNLMKACSTPRGFSDHPEGALRRVCAALLTMPIGGRILLIGVVAPLWGARAALLALLEWAIISIAFGLAGRAAEGVITNQDGASSGRTSVLLRLRDDGALARTLGTLVRGSLLPLPPAVLGLLAVAALGVLGLHDLPGVLMIAPAVVMLLAAPGSAHPHTGRFDWLIPSLLLGAQVLYLAAVGLGARVPEPVIFVLVAVLVVRYTDLAFPGRPVLLAKPRRPGEQRGERGTALGWEGRLLLVGVAAAVGIATFAYLALTAYLGLLIFAKVVVSSQVPREEDRS